MKIAIFSDNFYPELSGISDSLIVLAGKMAAHGHEIHFYVPRYAKKDYALAGKPLSELNLGRNVKIIRLPSISYPAPTNQGRLAFISWKAWKEIKEWNPDVIHTQLFFGVGLSALLVTRLLKKPLVGTNHTEINGLVRYLPISSFLLARLFTGYVNWYYNQCKFVTFPSESIFLEMKEIGFRAPHKVLSNPVDTYTFVPSESAMETEKFKKKFGLSNSVLIYAGRLAKEKNIDVIIRALPLIKKLISDVNFAIAGHGVEKENLQELAEKLGVSENIKSLGTLDAKTLSELYKASEIFVIASTSETQGLSMMQGMSSGLPVIAANSRSLPEYVHLGSGFLIEPGDFQKLAGYAVQLLKNRKKLRLMGQASRRRTLEFSPENIAEAWEKIYADNI